MQQEYQRGAALLRAASAAHGEYETRELGGVYDLNWPDWYATYLLEHGWEEFVGHVVTVEALSGALRACDAAYKLEAPRAAWPDFYAQRLHARFASPS